MKVLIFKNRHGLYSVPFSNRNVPRIKAVIDRSILVDIKKDPFSKKARIRVFKIKKIKHGKPIKRHIKRAPSVMPLNMQIDFFKKRAKKFGVADDIINFDRLDPTLTLSENRGVMEDQIRGLSTDNDLKFEEISFNSLDKEQKGFIKDMAGLQDVERRMEERRAFRVPDFF